MLGVKACSPTPSKVIYFTLFANIWEKKRIEVLRVCFDFCRLLCQMVMGSCDIWGLKESELVMFSNGPAIKYAFVVTSNTRIAEMGRKAWLEV